MKSSIFSLKTSLSSLVPAVPWATTMSTFIEVVLFGTWMLEVGNDKLLVEVYRLSYSGKADLVMLAVTRIRYDKLRAVSRSSSGLS